MAGLALRSFVRQTFLAPTTLFKHSMKSHQATVKNHNISTTSAMASKLIFRQLIDYVSNTYTYILADPVSKKAVIIDPVLTLVERDLTLVDDLGLELIYALNTHVHADHLTGSGKIKNFIKSCTSVLSSKSGAKADQYVDDYEVINFGEKSLEVRHTPGHTNGCVTYVDHDDQMAFTGDAVLIRGCGRTDFQQGSSKLLYEMVHAKIFTLPEEYKLYPAHDYTGRTVTTVAEEKRLNPRLTKTQPEFVDIMTNLNLSYPAQLDAALPFNLVCGLQDELPKE